MTDLLSDIKAFLVTKGMDGDITSIDAIGEDPDTAIALYEYQGSNPLVQIPGVDRSVQIVVRDLSAAKSKALSRKLYSYLKTEDGIINFTPSRWALIHLRQSPFKMKVDESNRTYYVFNVGVTTHED